MLEQLSWDPPDHIIVPGGNLGNTSALGKALIEMRDLGLISRLPKLSVIQAEGANPFFRSIREHAGKQLIPTEADTLATAIRIGNPASWKKAQRVLEATQGTVEQVSEVEIAIAKAEIGSDGVGCEPASAVTLAVKVTGCPAGDWFRKAVSAVCVPSRLMIWSSGPLVLPAKLLSPE